MSFNTKKIFVDDHELTDFDGLPDFDLDDLADKVLKVNYFTLWSLFNMDFRDKDELVVADKDFLKWAWTVLLIKLNSKITKLQSRNYIIKEEKEMLQIDFKDVNPMLNENTPLDFPILVTLDMNHGKTTYEQEIATKLVNLNPVQQSEFQIYLSRHQHVPLQWHDIATMKKMRHEILENLKKVEKGLLHLVFQKICIMDEEIMFNMIMNSVIVSFQKNDQEFINDEDSYLNFIGSVSDVSNLSRIHEVNFETNVSTVSTIQKSPESLKSLTKVHQGSVRERNIFFIESLGDLTKNPFQEPFTCVKLSQEMDLLSIMDEHLSRTDETHYNFVMTTTKLEKTRIYSLMEWYINEILKFKLGNNFQVNKSDVNYMEHTCSYIKNYFNLPLSRLENFVIIG
jgi:hypothetical protein